MRKCAVLLAVLVLGFQVAQAGSGQSWTQLSLSTCRVDEFLAQNPQSDGRGVIIAVMDTGVDPSIPGLTTTPDGAVKVIDVQDFTGDGDIELHRVRLENGKLIEHDEDGAPIEYEPPTVPVADEERRWWFGTFDEGKFLNADQPDLNGNETTDDAFPVLVTALVGDGDDQAVCYVDTNMDRSFADEKPLRNYKLDYDTFVFHRDKPEEQIVPLTFAVNIFLRQAKVVMFFDNGAHGTHVAGIAAGCRINNQDGFNGVAPGAKLMGLKIGCGYKGGVSVTESMKGAFEYVGRYAREHGVHVVCNLSFGVDSEIEGNSDIDEWVDDFLRANPYVVFCTSAGNAGPGLSTVGTPSAASDCICVAALMAADSARDVAGWKMDDAVVTLFSSRGGELDKPDIATPGWSTSTVPRWERGGDFWAGTSMASPYAAGLCADLISHVLADDPAAKVRACDVRRALWLSARPAPGATALDMGYGIPVLPKAAELIEKLVVAAKDDPVIGYEISTPCPHGYKGRNRAAYWRSTYFPHDGDRQSFTIDPVFAPTVDAADRTSFTRKFELRSRSPWCRVEQESCYLRSEQSASVHVEYDASKLTEPGLHVGIVEALHDGMVAFRLVNTIIVPHRFTAAENFTRELKNQVVKGWQTERQFVAVPPGASGMRLVLSAPEGEESEAGFDRIFDPTGVQFRSRSRLDTKEGTREVERTFTKELMPGVWEVDVHADRPDKQWPYDLKMQFFGLHADPAEIAEGGKTKPSGELTVTNVFEEPVRVDADGKIEGFRRQEDAKFEGLQDELEYSVSLDDRFDRIRLDLEMTPEDYATTTDIGVMVKDGSGESLHSGAFDGRKYSAVVGTAGNKSVTVVITGGFAVADDQRETPITVKIDSLFASPVPVSVKYDGNSNFNFIPSVPMTLEYSTRSKLEDIPGSQRPVGYLSFRERSSGDEVLYVPLDIGG